MHNALAQALLLAAGRGERMRPLTDHVPKPLLEVQGKPLLQWHLEGLQRGGVHRVVINTAWLEEQFAHNPGPLFEAPPLPPVDIRYSLEGRDFGGALETAGGIVRALPQLAPVFWVAAGDVYAPEFAFSAEDLARFAAAPALAHIWLVPNPAHNPRGDFGLSETGMALNLAAGDSAPCFTFSTIALYKQAFSPIAVSRRVTPKALKPRWHRYCAGAWTMDMSLPRCTSATGSMWVRRPAWPNSILEIALYEHDDRFDGEHCPRLRCPPRRYCAPHRP